MRVRATATGTSHSNAIGQIELSCTPAGLALGLYGVGAYTEGYATGALTSGTRITVPYSGVKSVRARGDHIELELEAPGLPHDRLTLSRFTAGPGVPPLELRRRRLILQFTAFSTAAIATLAGTMLAPAHESQQLAWGALGYGAVAGSLVLALGFSLNQSLFVRPPGEAATREAFVNELSIHVGSIIRSDAPRPVKAEKPLPRFTAFLPRTAAAVGVTLAATILTGLVTAQRMLTSDDQPHRPVAEIAEPEEPNEVENLPPELPSPREQSAIVPSSAPTGGLSDPNAAKSATDGETATVERRCMCDRADSHLWKKPIPKLSALLIETRALPRKTFMKTEVQVAVVNNSDTPVEEITVHVQFYERKSGKRVATKERPLYFEGPLGPGEAVKWTTEARGSEFELSLPDLGNLGPNGDGAAGAEDFVELLKANHRPVRLHAARLLSYLGDPRAREASLDLKDAMRDAEGPYLRRILAATGETRVCDVEILQSGSGTVGACVYNATKETREGLGIQLNELAGTLDVDHPLADPPSLRAQQKWTVPGRFAPESGMYVRLPLPPSFLKEKDSSLEVAADRFDLLD